MVISFFYILNSRKKCQSPLYHMLKNPNMRKNREEYRKHSTVFTVIIMMIGSSKNQSHGLQAIAGFLLMIFLNQPIYVIISKKTTVFCLPAKCQRSLYPFYLLSYYIKWVKTSWTYSIYYGLVEDLCSMVISSSLEY